MSRQQTGSGLYARCDAQPTRAGELKDVHVRLEGQLLGEKGGWGEGMNPKGDQVRRILS